MTLALNLTVRFNPLNLRVSLVASEEILYKLLPQSRPWAQLLSLRANPSNEVPSRGGRNCPYHSRCQPLRPQPRPLASQSRHRPTTLTRPPPAPRRPRLGTEQSMVQRCQTRPSHDQIQAQASTYINSTRSPWDGDLVSAISA
jgi:hypothetical protein